VPHVPPRDLMKLAVHERHQPLEGTLVALPPLEQQSGDPGRLVSNGAIVALVPFLATVLSSLFVLGFFTIVRREE
jgi:hypothetical protein